AGRVQRRVRARGRHRRGPVAGRCDRRPRAPRGACSGGRSIGRPRLDGVIESLVEQIESRFADVQAQLADPEVIGDRNRYADAGREYSQLEPAAKLAEEWRLAVSDAEGAEELLAEGEDPEMREELRSARERIERLEEEIRLA